MASNEKSQQKEDEGIAITDSSHQLTSRYTLSDSSVKQLSVDRIHLQRAATFTIERYLKVFSETVMMMRNISDQLLFQPTINSLKLIAFNPTISAFAKVLFPYDFFDHAALPDSLLQDLRADANQFCRVPLRSMIHMLKAVHGPTQLTLELDPAEDFALAHLRHNNDVCHTYVINLHEAMVNCNTVFDNKKKLRNHIAIQARQFIALLAGLDCLEAKFSVTDESFIVQNYIPPDDVDKMRKTMLTIPIEKFDIYRIVNPSEIVINLQHFRSILYFGDRCGGMSVNVHFEGNSKPMIIAVEENIDFSVELIISTIEELARQEADPEHSQKPTNITTNIIDNEQEESSKLNDEQMDPEPVDPDMDLYEPEPEQVDEDGQIQEQQMEPIGDFEEGAILPPDQQDIPTDQLDLPTADQNEYELDDKENRELSSDEQIERQRREESDRRRSIAESQSSVQFLFDSHTYRVEKPSFQLDQYEQLDQEPMENETNEQNDEEVQELIQQSQQQELSQARMDLLFRPPRLSADEEREGDEQLAATGMNSDANQIDEEQEDQIEETPEELYQASIAEHDQQMLSDENVQEQPFSNERRTEPSENDTRSFCRPRASISSPEPSIRINEARNNSFRSASPAAVHVEEAVEDPAVLEAARNFQRWWLSLSQESLTEEEWLANKRVICYESDPESE